MTSARDAAPAPTPAGNARPICVVGLGLIGGSLVRASVAAGRTVWAATASGSTASAARADGYDVALSTDEALAMAADADALVVLATPLTAITEVLRRVDAVAPNCRLTDVVSVQVAMRDLVEEHAPTARYVGGHPMAGTADSGWAAGSATLFDGANWVVETEDGVETGAGSVWADVAELAWACGSRVVPAGAEEHDAAVARISHLPHIMAAVLAAVAASDVTHPGRGFDVDLGGLPLTLAAGSFTDGTRVMDTRPELVVAMCEGNRSALLAAVDDALGRLGAARGSLASTGGLAATVAAGHTGRQHWQSARNAPEVRIPPARKPAELRDLGREGKVLTGWS